MKNSSPWQTSSKCLFSKSRLPSIRSKFGEQLLLELLLDRHMMTHLPEPVSEQDIMEMFRSLLKMFQMHINFVQIF